MQNGEIFFYADAANELARAKALPKSSSTEKEIRSDAIKNARIKMRSAKLLNKYGIENVKVPDKAVKEELMSREANNFIESIKIKRELSAYLKAVSVYNDIVKPYTSARDIITQAENYTHYDMLEERYLQLVNNQ